MERRRRLFEIADAQQGFFTAGQAKEAGYFPSNFHRMISAERWVKEHRGIYRLAEYPIVDRPELVLWSLWSRNFRGEPQGTWSHHTAMDLHELSDLMPAKLHMTVPKNFRREKIPRVLVLHQDNLSPDEIEEHRGYRVTTPLRTLVDLIRLGTVEETLIIQGVKEAMQNGKMHLEEIRVKRIRYPEVHRIWEIANE